MNYFVFQYFLLGRHKKFHNFFDSQCQKPRVSRKHYIITISLLITRLLKSNLYQPLSALHRAQQLILTRIRTEGLIANLFDFCTQYASDRITFPRKIRPQFSVIVYKKKFLQTKTTSKSCFISFVLTEILAQKELELSFVLNFAK